MAVLTDTNTFLRLLQPKHPDCRFAGQAFDLVRAREESTLEHPVWTPARETIDLQPARLTGADP
jgi:hypothetical protein